MRTKKEYDAIEDEVAKSIYVACMDAFAAAPPLYWVPAGVTFEAASLETGQPAPMDVARYASKSFDLAAAFVAALKAHDKARGE